MLIAVNDKFTYLEILDEKTGKQFIILEGGLSMLYKDLKKAKYKIIKKIPGKELVGLKYEPLFPYFAKEYSDCFQVIAADYVAEDEGTGVVHQAPAFGEEDYTAAVAAGFFGPKRLPPCPLDEKGQFTSEVPDYEGQHVKKADKAILKHLRDKTDRLLVESHVMHVDKFCPRSDTQLIRRAVSSWFIKVTNAIPQILTNLDTTNWTPSFVKEKRFKNWIEGAHDWNVSRYVFQQAVPFVSYQGATHADHSSNRYWGTPIPLWVSEDFEEVVCIGSRKELRELSGFTGSLDDIHRDKIDHITIPSKKGKGELRRVNEVFDCWYVGAQACL